MTCVYIRTTKRRKTDVMRRACGKFNIMFGLLKKGYVCRFYLINTLLG